MDYKEEIIDHYKHPRNFGELEGADKTVREANASCGDMVEVQVKMDGGKIKEVKWRGVGCAISTAASSMLSEKVIGMNKEDLEKFGEKGVIDLLGGEVNAGRMKCALLGYKAMVELFYDGK